MGEFTPITSQEQLDSVIKDRLERERKKFDGFISPDDFKQRTSAFEQQIAEANKTISENAEKYKNYDKDLAERDAKIKGYEIVATKNRIAHEKGLSYEAIDFLNGETEEEIGSSAERLKKMMGSNFVPDFNSDNRGKPNEDHEAYAKLAGAFKNK